MKRAVFTGGHHTSALVVAKELQAKGWQVVWFGHRRSMWGDKADSAEYREVTAAGIKFYNLLAGKFYRTYHPLKLIRLPFGFIQAFWWLWRLRPRVIVSFGGYLAVPTVICGWVLGIAAVTHEQTVVAGWANRLIALFAQKIAVTWPQSTRHYPKDKVVVTGLPLRSEMEKIKNLKLKIKNLVYITGGKQGAQAINQVVFKNIAGLTKNYQVVHQTGFRDYPQASQISVPGYQAFDFDSSRALDNLARAEVVVSRAGAHTVYELGFLGKRSVLIPIPWVSHDEQLQNAQILVEAGLGVILPEAQISCKSLITAIERAKKLAGQAMNLPTQADKAMVQLIEQVAHG